MKYYYTYSMKFGSFVFVEENEKLIEIAFSKEIQNAKEKETNVIKKAHIQLEEYFQAIRKEFDIPIQLNGTPFQIKVWNALMKIPYGKSASYKDIAVMIGNENASRAVGMANHNNPIPFIVPCHRIIGTNGKLTGYALGLDLKEELLKMEGII